jgi:hypothetical protein
MPDIATISAALTSLKAATDIAKFLRESDLSLEKAELKLKLADLVEALADTKMKVAEIQEELIAKGKKIAELEEAFEIKDNLIRHLDAYYVADIDGKPVGLPQCLRCWQDSHKKRGLVYHHSNTTIKICTSCGQQYDAWSVPDIKPSNQ